MNVFVSKTLKVQPKDYEGYDIQFGITLTNTDIGYTERDVLERFSDEAGSDELFAELKKQALSHLDSAIEEQVDLVRDTVQRKSFIHKMFPPKNTTEETTTRTRTRRV